MQQIDKIYGNSFGMAFYWKKEGEVLKDKVQLVFKETGFYLSAFELSTFFDCIEDSRKRNSCCADCQMKNNCAKFLLKTPCAQIDLAVSMKELQSIKDLVQGALFRIRLEKYVYTYGRN